MVFVSLFSAGAHKSVDAALAWIFNAPTLVVGGAFALSFFYGADISFFVVYTVIGTLFFGATVGLNLLLAAPRPAATADDSFFYALPDIGFVNVLYVLMTYVIVAQTARTRVSWLAQALFVLVVVLYAVALVELEFLTGAQLAANLSFGLGTALLVAIFTVRVVHWLAFLTARTPWARRHHVHDNILEPADMPRMPKKFFE